MKLRFAEETDVEEVVEMFQGWAKELFCDVSPNRLKVEATDAIMCGRLFLVEIGDKIVGFLGARVHQPIWNGHRVAHEQYLLVDPKYRGRKIVDILMGAMETWAKAQGCKQITFHPHDGVPRYEELSHYYQRKGYGITGYEVTKEL